MSVHRSQLDVQQKLIYPWETFTWLCSSLISCLGITLMVSMSLSYASATAS